MESKFCRKCLIDKPLTEYNKSSSNKDKLKHECKECNKKYLSNYRKNNYEKVLKKEREYETKNHNKRSTYRKINKIKINNYMKVYRVNNKDKVKFSINTSKNKRYKLDPIFKLKENIRRNINSSFKRNGFTKISKTYQIIGCTYPEFKQHIESLWQPWMNWDNYGNPKDGVLEPNKTWDIDHIIPTSSAKTEEKLLKLCHFSNLQPLCSYVNRIIKKNK